MINIDIPGREEYNIENVVFDYNGTLALDGKMSKKTMENIKILSKYTKVYILTADTYGNAREYCYDLPVNLKTFPSDNASEYKKEIVEILEGQTICFGNGFNDIEMFKVSDLAICILGDEGCSGKLIGESDIVLKSIDDAFDMLSNTNRIKATLRG